MIRYRSLRRTGQAALLVLSIFALRAGLAADAAYPSQPITIVVPAGAGSGPDLSARKIAAGLGTLLGQPVIVDNRPGAGGIPATQFASRAAADGYTLYLGTNAAMCINPALYRSLPYDPGRDFVPISMAARGSPVLLVRPDLPVRSLGELVRYAKDHAGKLSYASSGNGSTSHLTMELLKRVAGIDLLHVPYKDEARAISDVIGGQVDVTVAFSAVAVGHVQSGRLRALAVAGPKRNPLLPQVPTAAEQGYPDFRVSGWIGFFAPANTQAQVLARLEHAFVSVESSEAYSAWITSMGSEAIGSTAKDFADELRSDCPHWARVVKDAGVRLDY